MAKKAKKAKGKKPVRALNVILAVAIGEKANNWDFTDPLDTAGKLGTVRPYIKGLVDWLANQKDSPKPDETLDTYTLGNQYMIKYRECEKNELQATFDQNPDLILCMSTTVLFAAQLFTQTNKTTTPIVGIISNPENQTFDDNVCGVSARRPQHVLKAYKAFQKSVDKKTQIFCLHKKTYGPSNAGKFFLPKKSVTPIEIGETDTSDDIVLKIRSQLPKNDAGLLVLPVDQFFGAADKIIAEAKNSGNSPTWWLVPDMKTTVGIPFGAYGVPQLTCGRYMAERVASIWTNKGRIPDPPFVEIDDKENDVRAIKALKARKKK